MRSRKHIWKQDTLPFHVGSAVFSTLRNPTSKQKYRTRGPFDNIVEQPSSTVNKGFYSSDIIGNSDTTQKEITESSPVETSTEQTGKNTNVRLKVLKVTNKQLDPDLQSRLSTQIQRDTSKQGNVEFDEPDMQEEDTPETEYVKPDLSLFGIDETTPDIPVPPPMTEKQNNILTSHIQNGGNALYHDYLKYKDRELREKRLRRALTIPPDQFPEVSYWDYYEFLIKHNNSSLPSREKRARDQMYKDSMTEQEEKEVERAIQMDEVTTQVSTNQEPVVDEDTGLKYPFNSKVKDYNFLHNTNFEPLEKPKEEHIKTMQSKAMRPTFSKQPGAYQMDIMFVRKDPNIELPEEDTYQDNTDPSAQAERERRKNNLVNFLVLININTRYLFLRRIPDKTTLSILKVLDDITRTTDIKYINGDAESGFKGARNIIMRTRQRMKLDVKPDISLDTIKVGDSTYTVEDQSEEDEEPLPPVDKEGNQTVESQVDGPLEYETDNDNLWNIEKMTFQASKYTYHNKLVDSVIRTLRNAAGLDEKVFLDDTLREQLVDYYNNTPHSSLPTHEVNGKTIHYTPAEMQSDVDLEWQYIRKKIRDLQDVVTKQRSHNLDDYQQENILLLYMDEGKTSRRFEKRRRNFQDLGAFIKYTNGNCYVYCITKPVGFIEVPIFYTKRVAKNIDDLSPGLCKYFAITETTKNIVRSIFANKEYAVYPTYPEEEVFSQPNGEDTPEQPLVNSTSEPPVNSTSEPPEVSEDSQHSQTSSTQEPPVLVSPTPLSPEPTVEDTPPNTPPSRVNF